MQAGVAPGPRDIPEFVPRQIPGRGARASVYLRKTPCGARHGNVVGRSRASTRAITLAELDRADALALVDAGYMPLARYLELFGAQ